MLQFTSDLWIEVGKQLRTQHHCTTAYHTQANGLVERFHRHLKAALCARLIGPKLLDELPWVLLGIRTAPKEDLDTSSAELIYSSPLTVPGDFLISTPSAAPSDHIFLSALRAKIQGLTPVPTS